jgi:hypothetical protein
MTCLVLYVDISYGCHLFYDAFSFDGLEMDSDQPQTNTYLSLKAMGR